jgi:nitrile hydratase
MDGMHDLGGKQGFGQVRHSPAAGTYHAAWEKRVNAMVALAVKRGLINMDEYRHAIERMEPRHYLAASYYERSLTGLATLCVEKGVVTREELERHAHGVFPLSRPGAPGRTNAPARERFRSGDRVRVKEEFVPGHIRMPGYIRGKTGIVVRETPAYPYPDAHAHGVKASDEPTYDVAFQAEDLWPNGADPATVHAGVFQSYLERAG